ncbi:MAG: Ppx/GppA phosphatase family protein [Actinomycetota bacterium]
MDSVVATIDCGTNSTRMLIAQRTHTYGYETLARETRITQLGEGVDRTQNLSMSAIDRVLATLFMYKEKLQEHKVTKVRMVATSAVRDATNGQIFLEAAEEIIEAKTELLSGSEEARLSFLGATNELEKSKGPFFVIDIGGGSTEFSFGVDECESHVSTDIGCVRLSERFIHHDPPLPEELSAALSLVDLHLDDVVMEIPWLTQAASIIGVAGTVSATSMIEQGLQTYSYEDIHGHAMSKESIEEVFRLLVTDDRTGRLSNPGMEEGRVDVIIGGLCILVQIMRKFDFKEILVSEKDILDGLAISLFH